MPAQAPADLLAEMKQVATAHFSDNMNRLNAVDAAIRPMHDGTHMAGTAITVKVAPADNLMVHKAIDMCRPGDVIVVDAGGMTSNAIIGEIMSALAESRGAAGIIIDGSIRDAGSLAAGSFPVFARGVTHRGPYKNGPGEINVPISLGGTTVQPGDIMVGDEDGLVVVPLSDARDLLKAARDYALKEQAILLAIKNRTLDRSWVDKLLKEKGCDI